ncbi:hypothetical protein PINS_up013750 [Pythium insidiosum]|nr:hypothetical protein PINS_up013750 [Pythium insidiosum]
MVTRCVCFVGSCVLSPTVMAKPSFVDILLFSRILMGRAEALPSHCKGEQTLTVVSHLHVTRYLFLALERDDPRSRELDCAGGSSEDSTRGLQRHPEHFMFLVLSGAIPLSSPVAPCN